MVAYKNVFGKGVHKVVPVCMQPVAPVQETVRLPAGRTIPVEKLTSKHFPSDILSNVFVISAICNTIQKAMYSDF